VGETRTNDLSITTPTF